MKLVKADGCITNAKEERIRKHELHGGGLLDIGLYPIQFACLVYGEMPETITALGNITQTGMCPICLRNIFFFFFKVFFKVFFSSCSFYVLYSCYRRVSSHTYSALIHA